MASAPPRRFNVEPIETITRSSKTAASSPPDAAKPVRRFIPEPIETTTKTHRKADTESPDSTAKPARRFVPEPIETTSRSTRDRDSKASASCVRPGLIQTTSRGSRDKFAQEWEVETKKKAKIEPSVDGGQKRPPRRFAPQLIETARRSRRAGDSAPTILASDKTEAVSGNIANIVNYARRFKHEEMPPPPENTPTVDVIQNPLFLEIKRATSPLTMRRPCSRGSLRSHHSFRVPDLDPIESSESEGSSPPSPSTSPSIINSDSSYMYKDSTRIRESVDARSSGYLLELAAKAAEKQLREQAMAAFPNDDHHERVDHYIDHDSEDSGSYSEETARRRESAMSEVNWELVAMRQHRDRLEKQQEEERQRNRQRQFDMNRLGSGQSDPWRNPVPVVESKDAEMDRMRKGARPPMLGKSIRFPRCQSPEPARFDTTQGCDAVRIAMCYLSEQSQQAEKGEGLWCGRSHKPNPSARPSLYSNPSSRPPSRNGGGGGGLWGGFCVNTGNTPPRGPSGLLTPRVERANPLSPCPTPQTSLLPPTPPASHADFACIDEKLATEAAIEEDFGDDFVTQVYNYLSLGYPSIARMFDDELSKISNIPMAELRQDDHLASSRGYIRLGADGNLTNTEITEESCMRWRALRIYIREWARQHPNMAQDSVPEGMGTAVRKGSWAV